MTGHPIVRGHFVPRTFSRSRLLFRPSDYPGNGTSYWDMKGL